VKAQKVAKVSFKFVHFSYFSYLSSADLRVSIWNGEKGSESSRTTPDSVLDSQAQDNAQAKHQRFHKKWAMVFLNVVGMGWRGLTRAVRAEGDSSRKHRGTLDLPRDLGRDKAVFACDWLDGALFSSNCGDPG
jgi:hypothetical protein